MPDLKLSSQFAYAREHLDNGAPEQAVQVCRRILETFPRCVDAYVALGEALLALGQTERAADLLGRAWGACPTDPAVHEALASVAEQRGQFELGTTWRKRAAEIRGQALVTDDLTPAPLTRPALCYGWLRQGMYAHAARELGVLVAESPTCYDLEVTLAVARWQSGDKTGAARLCREILKVYPHCLAALLIAGTFWLHTDDDEQARDWLLAAQALDPQNALAQSLLGAQSPLPPRSARLPFRDEDAPPLDLPFDEALDLEDDDWPEDEAFLPSLGL